MTLEEMMNDSCTVSVTQSQMHLDKVHGEHDLIFDLTSAQRKISSMYTTPELLRDESINSGSTDVPNPNTFISTGRHCDVTAQDLSDRWSISLKAATNTLKKTTQWFLRSAVLPLSRRYCTDMMFERKTLQGPWFTDTMDRRCKSFDGNQYAQVFANKAYFYRI